MSSIVSVGSTIEGGMHVDLDEVRTTPQADQWKHTDLLCGLIEHLRDELAHTTADLAVACEVARERGEARPADYSPVHLYPDVPSPRRPLCGSAGSGRMVARTEGELRGICVACVDAALAQAPGALGDQSGRVRGRAGTDPRRGAASIAVERRRQIEVEGYTPEHDARHRVDTLVKAAGAYLGLAEWPWGYESFKPDPDDDGMYQRRDLVKAGALIAAAIDLLDGAQ